MENLEAHRPAFFEVYAANHLNAALRPALRFVLEVLSVRHPALVRAAAWSDEIFTSLLLVMETSQLRKESALLAESFYSLRRSSNKYFNVTELPIQPLKKRQVFLSVLFSVVLPHIKARLDSWYSNVTGGAAAELFEEGFSSFMQSSVEQGNRAQPVDAANFRRGDLSRMTLARTLVQHLNKVKRIIRAFRQFLASPGFERLLLKWYPRVATVCESVNLCFNFFYLLGHTSYFSLPLAIQGLVLRRASPIEVLQRVARKQRSTADGASSINIADLISNVLERMVTVLKAGFFASIFAFRFLQYYYAAEASVPRDAGPILAAPSPLQPAEGVDRNTALLSGTCPLCSNARVSPTACTTSGYVFCYLCIYRHVQSTRKCPVTLAPTSVDDLVRVYDDANAQG